MKRCPDCERDLPVSAFRRNIHVRDRLMLVCTDCLRIRWQDKPRRGDVIPVSPDLAAKLVYVFRQLKGSEK